MKETKRPYLTPKSPLSNKLSCPLSPSMCADIRDQCIREYNSEVTEHRTEGFFTNRTNLQNNS